LEKKAFYESPQIEVTEFKPEDSIAASNGVAVFEQIWGGGDNV